MERRIGWFACQMFLRETTARCKVSDRPNRTDWLCCSPLVSMMETADLRQFHHAPEFRWLNQPGLRRIFDQRYVSSAPVIIVQVAFQDGPEMPFSKNDHMVQALSANGSDQPLHVGALPGAGRSGEDFFNVHALD